MPDSMHGFLPGFLPEFGLALAQTLGMLAIALAAALVLGGPLGVALVLANPDHTGRARILGWIVDAVRSFPFVLLLIALAPCARIVAGSAIGPLAASVPLSLAAVVGYARSVERTLRRVPPGTVEAVEAMGASPLQVVTHVLLVEARSQLVLGWSALAVTLLACAVAAGAVDGTAGGGIGALAVRHGVLRFDTDIVLFTVAVLAALVQIIQFSGAALARRMDRGAPAEPKR